MSCKNCYNGCTDIISDQCIKYTGIDIDPLGIHNGDTLASVQSAIMTFLTSAISGTGIVVTVEPSILCDLVSSYLPSTPTFTLVDLLTALIQSSCSLQEQMTAQSEQWAALNAEFTVSCITEINNPSDIRSVIEGMIVRICTQSELIESFLTILNTDYVRFEDLNSLIKDYLDSTAASTFMSNKMVPYVAMEYYGPLNFFDTTGAGIGDWKNIYLCNGNNNTPDKRGRVSVGATVGMGGPAFDPVVDPSISGNPNYALLSKGGTNNITLSVPQIPSHAHANSASISPNPHSHSVQSYAGVNTSGNHISSGVNGAASGNLTGDTNLSVTMVNGVSGGGLSHPNIQPVIGCYYIIYIP